MLTNTLLAIYNQIANDAHEMVTTYVDKADLTGKVNYASIFAHSQEEFVRFTKEIEANGAVYDVQSTGNYYLLNKPFTTRAGTVSICRVRTFDTDHAERGYLDFEVVNYKKFKTKYLQQPHFLLMKLPHVEIVELRVPGYNVRAYFPDGL